jgi:hypothetical protein
LVNYNSKNSSKSGSDSGKDYDSGKGNDSGYEGNNSGYDSNDSLGMSTRKSSDFNEKLKKKIEKYKSKSS